MTPAALFADRALLAATKLELPPIAELASTFWTGDPLDLPIRLRDLAAWLGERVRT